MLHVVDESLLPSHSKHEAAAKSAIAAHLAPLSSAEALGNSQEVIRGFGYSDISVSAAELKAEPIVLGIHRHKSRELFQGTTAERVVRYGTLPVLVVKRRRESCTAHPAGGRPLGTSSGDGIGGQNHSGR